MPRFRILLIEDSPDDAELIRSELERARLVFDLHRVDTRDDLMRALAEHWDVALADHDLPALHAPDVLAILHARRLDLPVIVVSSTVGEDSAVHAMKAGAADYFRKDNLQRLPAAIEREVAERQTRDEKRSLEAQLVALLATERRLREEAERANRAKEEFLAMLSHELRTPLNAVLGRVHQLRRAELSPELRETACETIERNAGALAQIVDDLLDVSRMAGGRLAIEREPIAFESVLEAAIVNVVPLADRKQLRLASRIEPLPQVIGDAARLRQVLDNVLGNAVKFTPSAGEIQIDARTTAAHALVEIADTGPGIDPAFLPHIFDWFRQEDQSPKRRHGGLGLGLAIARHVVALHGGTLSAANRPEGGAVFTLALPIRDGVPAEPPPIEPPRRRGTLHGARILIVEDDRDSRELLGDLLADCGAEICTAASVPEALAALERFAPEILISDIGMPEQDGYDLIRAVRSLPAERGGGVPAIALTAYASTEDREQVTDAGFQLHITKPINPQKLLAAIARLAPRH